MPLRPISPGDQPRDFDPSRNKATPAALKILAIMALAALAFLIREILLYGFLAILIAVIFDFPVSWLARHRFPRGLAVIFTLFTIPIAFTGFAFATYPVVSRQVQSLIGQAPIALKKIENFYQNATINRLTQNLAKNMAPSSAEPSANSSSDSLRNDVARTEQAVAKMVFPAARGAVGILSTIVLVLVLAAFLVHRPDVYIRGLRILVPLDLLDAFDEGFRRLSAGLRQWVGGILISMTVVGCVSAIGLKIAGVENWILLGILTFFGTFIPYLGAICSSLPGLLMGLAQDPRHLLYAAIVYLCVHITEGYIVQPWVMRRAVEVSPATLLMGQAAFGLLLGLPGLMVATPLLACIQIATEYFYVERKLGKRPALI